MKNKESKQDLTESDIELCIKLSKEGIRLEEIMKAIHEIAKILKEIIDQIIEQTKPFLVIIQENMEYMEKLKNEGMEEKMEEKKYSMSEFLDMFDKAVEKMDELVDEATKDHEESFGKFMMKIQNTVVAGMIKSNLIEVEAGVDNE